MPDAPSTRTRWPFLSAVSTPCTDMTAGICIYLAVTAPWDSGPPLSVTTAHAL